MIKKSKKELTDIIGATITIILAVVFVIVSVIAVINISKTTKQIIDNAPEKNIITIERIDDDEYIIRDVEIEIKEARRDIRKPGLSVSKSTHTAQPIVRQANRKVSNGL